MMGAKKAKKEEKKGALVLQMQRVVSVRECEEKR